MWRLHCNCKWYRIGIGVSFGPRWHQLHILWIWSKSLVFCGGKTALWLQRCSNVIQVWFIPDKIWQLPESRFHANTVSLLNVKNAHDLPFSVSFTSTRAEYFVFVGLQGRARQNSNPPGWRSGCYVWHKSQISLQTVDWFPTAWRAYRQKAAWMLIKLVALM